jgi:hypothetical protein
MSGNQVYRLVEDEPLLSVSQVAERLGVSDAEARQLLNRAPVVRIGLGPRPLIRVHPRVVDRLARGEFSDPPSVIQGREVLHRTCWRKYGMSLGRYDRLMAAQNDACAICRRPFAKRGLGDASPCIDHCHETRRVRGLLCGPCNRGIGHFQDDVGRIRQAAAYLGGHE